MTFQPPGSGLNNTAEYVASPLPWVSSSVVASGSVWRIDFPKVTSEIHVHNATPADSSVGVAFTLSGALGTNRFLIGTNQTSGNSYVGETFSFRTRVKTLYIVGLTGSSTVSVFAGLTMINPRAFPILTGSSPTQLSLTGSTTYDPYFSYDGLG
jgi:hypothetical protein